MNTSWITSCEVIISFTDVPTGTCSSFTSAWPSGCWNFHIHCLPTTYTLRVSAGGRAIAKNSFALHPKMKRTMTSGMTVHAISSLRFP